MTNSPVVIDLSPQEAYDRMVQHFSRPGTMLGYEAGSSGCMYRTPRGHACAVGCLVTDEEAARLDQEPNRTAHDLVDRGELSVSHIRTLGFLKTAQYAHDASLNYQNSVERFLTELKANAVEFGLNV